MFVRIWPLLVLVAVFLSALHHLINEDYWFHLRGGQLVSLGQLPRVDTYSYPSAGNAYIDLHWLFQWLLYQIHQIGGVKLAIFCKATCVTATFGVLYRLARKDAAAPIAGAAVFAGALLASERFMVRPEFLTFLFLALTLWLARRLEDGFRPALWLLPLLFVLWVNCEGLFIVGLAALGAHAVGNPKDKALWIALGASALACLLNPFFLDGALHPLILFSRVDGSIDVYSSTIAEFLSPFDTSTRHPAATFFPWFLALLALGLVACRRPRVREIVLTIGFLFLALKARRNIALLGIVAVPILARWFSVGWASVRPWFASQSEPFRLWATRGAALAALATVVVYSHSIVSSRAYVAVESNRIFGLGIGEGAFPIGAANFLQTNQIPGPMFAGLSSGSYLTWGLPEVPVFVDGRLEVHSTEHFSRSIAIGQGGAAWSEADREFNFRIVLIDHGKTSGLMEQIVRDPNWAMVYLDAKSLVLLKKVPENQPFIDQFALTRGRMLDLAAPIADEATVELLPPKSGWFDRKLGKQQIPWDALNLGQFLAGMAANDLAAEQYRRATWAAPTLASPRVLLATALNQLGRPNEALEVVLSADPFITSATDQARVWVTQGDILLGGGHPDRAIESYSAFLRAPNSGANEGVVRIRRGQAKLESGDPAGAVKDCRDGLGLIQNYADAYRILGNAEEALGRKKEALAAFEQFIQLGGQNPEVDAAIARIRGQEMP